VRRSRSVLTAPSAGVGTLNRIYNRDFRWDRFNPEWYFHHNYDSLRQDDRLLLGWLRDEFVHRLKVDGSARDGIDIGPGANLYPALALAPFCETITLRDFAGPNVDWLRTEIGRRFRPSWYEFWNVLCADERYKSVADPWTHLQERTRFEQGSVFDLPKNAYGIGTMFFVAESITCDFREFRRAVQSFVESLRPGAPFAAAFMKGSRGYQVDTESYPAVAIDTDRVKSCLAGVAYDCELRVIELHETDEPLRDGYDGMILATGRRTKLRWEVSSR
jgi:NNMT/PNMT/TEMT family